MNTTERAVGAKILRDAIYQAQEEMSIQWQPKPWVPNFIWRIFAERRFIPHNSMTMPYHGSPSWKE